MKLSYQKIQLRFKRPARTSRGEMLVKNGYLLFAENNGLIGTGECSFIEGLSIDPLEKYEDKLQELCETSQPENIDLSQFPSIAFGYETASIDFKNGGRKILFESKFTQGISPITINGLLWMGSEDFIMDQLHEKIAAGFSCIKMKIGGLDFETECRMLTAIRKSFDANTIELRLDANGAFAPNEALEKLQILSRFQIHSIEQPIRQGNWTMLRKLCEANIIPVALDEELIGNGNQKLELLEACRPQYIILKPSLLGGFSECDEWIDAAEQRGIGWWATSALESNVGLNAIAQWAATKKNILPQGLGTGSLYESNIPMPLEIRQGALHYLPIQNV